MYQPSTTATPGTAPPGTGQARRGRLDRLMDRVLERIADTRLHRAWAARTRRRFDEGYRRRLARIERSGVEVDIECNICGAAGRAPLNQVADREHPSCSRCHSSLRNRSLIYLLSTEVLGGDGRLTGAWGRPDPAIRGLGLSDSPAYSEILAGLVDYTNTFLHREPYLDITSIDPGLEGLHDFVISSDVLEHVMQPIDRAFANLLRLLRPGGLCLLTVPYVNHCLTVEHYPGMVDSTLEQENGRTVARITLADGSTRIDRRPIVHLGEGEVLELREWSRLGLKRDLARAGFTGIRFCRPSALDLGIHWPITASLPVIARRPLSRQPLSRQPLSR